MIAARIRIALILLAAAIPAAAQDAPPVHFSLKLPRRAAPLKPGDRFDLTLAAKIDAGWHLYSINQGAGGPQPTQIGFGKNQIARLTGSIDEPPPRVEFDNNFNIETAFFEDEVDFRLPVEIVAGKPPGKHRVAVDVRYQVCDARLCLPATTVTAATDVDIAGGTAPSTAPPAASETAPSAAAPAPPPEPAPPTPAQTPSPTRAPSDNFASFLWLSMTMGALSLLTPCVFPMVPITVSYFSNHAGGTRRSALALAAIYAIGIILTFSALGLALAAVFGAGGVNQLAANPWVNLAITAIFLAFALSLFGAFFIQVPTGLMNRLDSLTRSREGGRVAGALLMGFTFTLTSFTCTAPFVGTLLVMAAQGSWRWPLSGMLAYSAVFALPFFVLALAPQLVSQMPRAGGWMNSVKVLMGFLEVAAAMKFLSNADLVWRWGIFTREVVLSVWIAVGILAFLYILGYLRLAHDSPVKGIGAARLTLAMIFLAITIALVPGLFGRPLGELDSFLPPPAAGQSAIATESDLPWILNDYDGARQKAVDAQKLLFVDFTGYTCTNCRWMEANMFPRPEVRRELERFVTVRLYTDGTGPVFDRQQKMQQTMFHTVALPLYAILRPDGSPVATFPGLTRDTNEFLTFLRRQQ